MKTLEVKIYGRVQGVAFRYSAIRFAREISISGFVKNCPDGSVLVVATGNEDQLELLLDWCRRGPARAIVEELEISERPFREFQDFSIH